MDRIGKSIKEIFHEINSLLPNGILYELYSRHVYVKGGKGIDKINGLIIKPHASLMDREESIKLFNKIRLLIPDTDIRIAKFEEEMCMEFEFILHFEWQ